VGVGGHRRGRRDRRGQHNRVKGDRLEVLLVLDVPWLLLLLWLGSISRRHVPGGARVPLTFEVFGVEGAATDAVPKGEGDEGGEGEEDAEGDGEAPDGLALHAC